MAIPILFASGSKVLITLLQGLKNARWRMNHATRTNEGLERVFRNPDLQRRLGWNAEHIRNLQKQEQADSASVQALVDELKRTDGLIDEAIESWVSAFPPEVRRVVRGVLSQLRDSGTALGDMQGVFTARASLAAETHLGPGQAKRKLAEALTKLLIFDMQWRSLVGGLGQLEQLVRGPVRILRLWLDETAVAARTLQRDLIPLAPKDTMDDFMRTLIGELGPVPGVTPISPRFVRLQRLLGDGARDRAAPGERLRR